MKKVLGGAAAAAVLSALALAGPASAQEETIRELCRDTPPHACAEEGDWCVTLLQCAVQQAELAARDPQDFVGDRIEDSCETLAKCLLYNVEQAERDPVGYVQDRIGP
jgi:hypothetical protein